MNISARVQKSMNGRLNLRLYAHLWLNTSTFPPPFSMQTHWKTYPQKRLTIARTFLSNISNIIWQLTQIVKKCDKKRSAFTTQGFSNWVCLYYIDMSLTCKNRENRLAGVLFFTTLQNDFPVDNRLLNHLQNTSRTKMECIYVIPVYEDTLKGV